MWDYERITSGLITMVWGMFLKLVITDRISAVTDAVFSGNEGFNSSALWLGAIAFSLQIYCDFSGYSTIAIGAARVMGFHLMENFNTPYFSRSIKEFWRRWHISLSTWFRDYLYIPLGGNRCSRIRRYLNLMITFLVSGFWHGAGWTFIIWGGVHGAYQIVGEALMPVRRGIGKAFRINTESKIHKFMQTLVTSFLVVIGWVFFRAVSMKQAAGFLLGMFTPSRFLTGAGISSLGIGAWDWGILIASLLLLFLVSLIKYNRGLEIAEYLAGKNIVIRWIAIFAVLFGILIFGVYGPKYSAQAFIYFQF